MVAQIKKKFFGKISNFFGNYLNRIPTIEPFSYLHMIWDIAHYVIIMVNLIQIPYLVSFDRNPYKSWQFINICMSMINMFIDINKAYYDKGYLITQRSKIVM